MSAAERTADVTAVGAGSWDVVPDRCTASFTARELKVLDVHGRFPVLSGTVRLDADRTPVSVMAELSAVGVDTGNARRDKDLRGAFLRTEQYPTMRFVGSTVTPSAEGWSVEGTLEVAGTTSPLSLAVEVRAVDDASAEVVATGVVDRVAAGVTRGPAWLIGRTLPVRIEAELRRTGVSA